MKKRIKSLIALLMIVLLGMQSRPILTQAAMLISSDVTLTADDSEDGYIVTSGGTLRFAEQLAVSRNIIMNGGYDGANNYVIIPETGTMNGTISTSDQYDYIENRGTINSTLQLGAGTLTNYGEISDLIVAHAGIFFAKNGSSYSSLDIRMAGSGNAITDGTLTVDTLYLNAYAFSFECSETIFSVNNNLNFGGTSELQDNIQVHVKEDTKITTEGRMDFVVYSGGIKYPIPAIVFTEKTLGEIYSLTPSTEKLSYDSLAVGYQTVPEKTLTMKNDGLVPVQIIFNPGTAWKDTFIVTYDGEEIGSGIDITVDAGDSVALSVTPKKGLAADDYEAKLNLDLATADGTVFDSYVISGNLSVERKPSISAPESDFYSLSGTKGDNGYYTSDVIVTPSSEYSIAKSLSDDFADSITYSESQTKPAVYLLKKSTGQITEKAALETIKIDKDKPKISGVEAGETYYEDSVTVKVTDDNLSTVTVNGTKKSVEDGKATIKLEGGDASEKYVIKAVDKAGNVRKVTVYLAPDWEKDGAVPSGKSVSLKKNKRYSFGSGTWSVSGDSTSYAGGMDFYVASDGQYTFTSSN